MTWYLVKPRVTYCNVSLQGQGYLSWYRTRLRVQFPAKGREFFIRLLVQTGSGAYPTFYAMGTDSTFPGVKRPKREANN